MSLPHPTRRTFLKTLGAGALAAPFIARHAHAAAPSGVLRHASFGAAGQAWSDIQALTLNKFVNLVAVAEVDLARAAQVKAAFPNVKVFQDWRELLDKEGRNLDSVNVSTPDHMHAPIAYSAMQLGKHCYCQKPLAHDLHETRVLTRLAREKKLVTQMGIQIHSYRVYRQAVAIVQSGVIGKVKEVHTWSSKKWGDRGAPPARNDAVPSDFNWDLWLGNAAARPFVGQPLETEPDATSATGAATPATSATAPRGYYHPGNWRKRLDFGTGTFGDMGCHIFDPVFNALALTSPVSLRSEGPAPDQWNWSINAKIRYVFRGTKFTAGPTVPITWYDGDERPPEEIRSLIALPKPTTPAEEAAYNAAKKRQSTLNEGSIIIGTEGVLHVPHFTTPKLFPVEKFKDYKLPMPEQGDHYALWAEACLNGKTPSANFDYSGPLTEAVLLGSVAVRFPQTTLQWNAEKLQFDNERAANQYVKRSYRKGWEIAGLG